jgi:methylmalonyl-CoA epimerase
MKFILMQVDHVAIAVRSIEAALPFYAGGLGLDRHVVEDVPSEGVRTCFLETGETHVELLEPLGDDTPVGKFLARRGEGLHHVAFRVRDIEEAMRRLKAEGYALLSEAPKPGARGSRVAFLHPKGTHGVLYELVERK